MSQISLFIIYGLFDPRTGDLRYVGKSTSGLRRAKQHHTRADLRRHGRSHKSSWIKSLLAQGLVPHSQVLLECQTAEELYDIEQQTIAHYRSLGVDLTNMADGGPGSLGRKMSDETKEKIRKATLLQLPVVHTEETKERLRQLQLGRTHDEEIRRRMAKAHGCQNFLETTLGIGFESQADAARYFDISANSVGRVLRGERKTANGLVFVYV